MQRSIGAAFVLLLVTSACASYESTSPPVPVTTRMQATLAEQDIRVEARPYGNRADQEAYFDADFNAAGVVAVQVKISNNSSKSYFVRRHDMTLEVSEDIVISPVSSNSVAHTVGEDGSVIGAALAFGLIGLIAASSAEEQARTARTTDYQNKAFRDTTLDPGESRHGFVFFIPSQGTAAFDRATLKVRLTDSDGSGHVSLKLALKGMGYRSAGGGKSAVAHRTSGSGTAAYKEPVAAPAPTFTLPDEEPVHSEQEAAAYLESHRDDVKRDLFEYNKKHRLTRPTGTFRNYILHGTKILRLAGDQVIVKVSFDYGSSWAPRFASKVLRMQWVGPDLKIVGHS